MRSIGVVTRVAGFAGKLNIIGRRSASKLELDFLFYRHRRFFVGDFGLDAIAAILFCGIEHFISAIDEYLAVLTAVTHDQSC